MNSGGDNMKLLHYLQSVLIGIKTLIEMKCFRLLLSISSILVAVSVCDKKDIQIFIEKKTNHLVMMVESEIYVLSLSLKPSIEINIIKNIIENLNLKNIKPLSEEESLYTYLRLKYGITYSDVVIRNICQQYLIQRGD